MIDNDNHNGEPVPFVRNFDCCPNCHSTERFYESILKEAQDKGLVDKGVRCFDFQMVQNVAVPQQKIDILPVGSEIPAFMRIWDTCANCGLDYSIHLEKRMIKKSIIFQPGQMMPNQMPNRAERRQLERLKENLRPNNPFLS